MFFFYCIVTRAAGGRVVLEGIKRFKTDKIRDKTSTFYLHRPTNLFPQMLTGRERQIRLNKWWLN